MRRVAHFFDGDAAKLGKVRIRYMDIFGNQRVVRLWEPGCEAQGYRVALDENGIPSCIPGRRTCQATVTHDKRRNLLEFPSDGRADCRYDAPGSQGLALTK